MRGWSRFLPIAAVFAAVTLAGSGTREATRRPWSEGRMSDLTG